MEACGCCNGAADGAAALTSSPAMLTTWWFTVVRCGGIAGLEATVIVAAVA